MTARAHEPIDDRVRLAAGGLLVVAASFAPSLWAVGAIALSMPAMALAWRMPMRAWLRRALHLEGAMLALLVILPFSTPGHAVLDIGPLSASREGLVHALEIALRANAALAAVGLFVAGIGPERLAGALAGLGLPVRLAGILAMTVRYLGLLREEARRHRDAARARGFTAQFGIRALGVWGTIVGMTLIRAGDRAGRVREAMAARGFTGAFAHKRFGPLAGRDRMVLAAAFLAALALVAVS